MASWLQAQLKAAENLLEAVDRTVSATTGIQPPPPGPRESAGESEEGRAHSDTQSWQQQAAPGTTQIPGSYGSPHKGSSPLLAANVSRGLSWLQGSPQPSGSPAAGSPAHPAAAAAAATQQQQLWQPFVAQSPSTSTGPGPKLNAQASYTAAGSPSHSRTPPAAAGTPPGSIGSYTTKPHGPFSSSGSSRSSSLQPSSSTDGAQAAPWQSGAAAAAAAAAAAPFVQAGQPAASTQGPPVVRVQANGDAAPFVAPPVSAPQAAAADGVAVQGQQAPEPHNTVGMPEGPAAAAAAGLAAADTPEQLPQGLVTGPLAAAAPPAMTELAAADNQAPPAAAGDVTADALAPPAAASAASSSETQQPLASEPLQQQEQQHAATPLSASVDDASSSGPSAVPQPSVDAAEVASTLSSRAASDAQLGSSGPPTTEPFVDGAAAAADAGPSLAAPAGAAGAAAGAAAAAAAGGGGGSSSAKEAQLGRLVETLRKRLEVVRGENQQLEDMLHEAEQRSAAEQASITTLTAELTALQREQDSLVSSAAANAAAQDAHMGRLQAELDASSRQVAALQAELQAAQEQHAQALSSKDSMEGGALEALRAEVSTYEGQLETERRAHAATKAAAASRERDLEEQLGSSSEALAAVQRQLEEASSRAREAEEQQLLASAEASRLQQQVQQLGEQHAGAQQLDPQLQLQLEAEREALQRRVADAETQAVAAMQAQRAAEGRVAELQGEVAHLHSSYQAQAASRGAPQLEQQLRELQELLYQKQQQLERLSGEKQAQQLMLERQITSLKSELGKAHAAAAAAVTGVHMRGGHDIIPMDALGEPYQRLARHNKLGGAVQATANFLDTTAASASQLLRQQPLARLIVFLYIVLIHLYVYFLLARMQRQALLLVSQQDHGTGVGPELRLPMQAPPAPVLAPPLPVVAGPTP